MIGILHSIFALTFFFLLVLLCAFFNTQIGYSQNATLNEVSVQTPAALKGNYSTSDATFSITFPKGWSGVDHGVIAMVSPDGINQFNGNLKKDENKALMVIEVLNMSDFQQQKYGSAIHNNCRILSEKFSIVNAAQSKEVYIDCGADGDQKIINYIFGSGTKIFIIGLKGIGDSFENNLNAFRNSVRTVMIKNPIEIGEEMPSISSQN